jgi:hypothetical protein
MASSFSLETSEKVVGSGDDFALLSGFELRVLAMGELFCVAVLLTN